MARRIGQSTGSRGLSGYIKAFWLRHSILTEERLRREVASDEELRRKRPEVWRSREAARRAENKETTVANQRLRAMGLEPVRPRPSLAQRRQELHRLERRNEAAIAALQSQSSKSSTHQRGTSLARRRPWRRDD